MGSPVALIALIVHCPFGGIGFFLANPFPLLWVSEVVLAGSGLELSLSSSVGLGVGVGAYMDHTIWQVITHSL